MSLEIQVMQVGKGDCIWLRYGKEDKSNIIIDSGPANSVKEFKKIMDYMKTNNEVVDLLILTHIDDDHINGFNKFIAENSCDAIKKIWFHGKGARAYVSSGAHSPRNAPKLLDKIKSENIKVEEVYSKHEDNINGADFYVLTPTEEAVMEVSELIDYKCNAHSEVIHNQDIDYIFEKDKYKNDTSPTNGASISFLFTYENKCIAFLGDAHLEDILNNEEILKNIKIDYVKMAHHGSPYNINKDLIKALGCNKFIISTSKEIDKRTFARIVHELDKSEIYCNYPWFERNGYFTENDKEKYIKSGKLDMKKLPKNEFWNMEGDINDGGRKDN